MIGQLVRYELQEGVAFLTLNNPGRRNALSTELLGELKELLREFEDDDAVRVVVLRSEGPVFSSGHDLNEIIDRDAEAYTAVFALCTEVMEAIRLLPKPVIAQVQGLATAAGCQLVATCDLAVAAESACLRHPRRADWPLLHHPRRSPGPLRSHHQEGHGDAAHRHAHPGLRSPGNRPHQPRSS